MKDEEEEDSILEYNKIISTKSFMSSTMVVFISRKLIQVRNLLELILIEETEEDLVIISFQQVIICNKESFSSTNRKLTGASRRHDQAGTCYFSIIAVASSLKYDC